MRFPALLTAAFCATALGQTPIPEDLMDDPHVRAELAVNEFTAPSISKIFIQLDEIGPLTISDEPRELPEKMPLNRADLAIEIGFLISESFLQIQSGNAAKVEPLARELQLYGRALGAGDRVNRHAASLLESADKGDIPKLKTELAATQRDVEAELVSLRDADLAHLISLGGWARAFEVSSAAVTKHFSAERARKLFREDIADYYLYSVSSLEPRISQTESMKKVQDLLTQLQEKMTLTEGSDPTQEDVATVRSLSQDLVNTLLERH